MSECETVITEVNQSSRTIMLFGEINDVSAFGVSQGLLELQQESPLHDITLIINSRGGDIDELFAIIDMMNIVQPDIKTVVIGKAMSAGAYIAICRSKRQALYDKKF